MAAGFNKNVATMTVNGTAWAAKLLSFHNQAGVRPGTAILRAYLVTPGDVTNANVRGKQATISIDGTKVFTGYVLEIGKGLQGGIVDLFLYDLRWSLRRTFIGQNHLGNNALPVIGSDIVFNLNNNPNRTSATVTANVHKFVYEATGDDSKAAVYWTYRQILYWLFHFYVPDFTMPTLPAASESSPLRLDQANPGEVRIAWMRTDQAIELILSRCGLQLGCDKDGLLYVFDKDNPRGDTITLTFHPIPGEGGYKPAKEYSLDYPEDVYVRESIVDVVTDIYVVGGYSIREMSNDSDRYFDRTQPFEIVPNGTWQYQVTSGKQTMNISNYRKDQSWKYTFDKTMYGDQHAGKGYPISVPYVKQKPALSTLRMARTETGNFVSKDAPDAKYAVGTHELLSATYPLGYIVDHSELAVIVPRHTTPDGTDVTQSPRNWALPILTEERKNGYQQQTFTGQAVNYVASLVLRNDIQHYSREEIQVIAPVNGVLTRNADGTGSYTLTEPDGFTLPEGWTRDYTVDSPVALAANEKPPIPTLTVPEGTLVDGESEVGDMALKIKAYIGKPLVNVTAQWPSFKNVEVGQQIAQSGVDYGITGKEIVVGVSFDAERDITRIVATNSLHTDSRVAASSFVSNKSWRP